MNALNVKRILIVEDNGSHAKLTGAVLRKYGYNTEVVTSGAEAVAKVRGSQCPNLILMDIELGDGMDGAQAARIIQQFSDVPVGFLTTHTEREIVEKILSVTAYGYVLKGAGEQCWYQRWKWRCSFMAPTAKQNCTKRFLKTHCTKSTFFSLRP